MSNEPEHKQLAEDLRRAKAKRIQAQTAMFAQPVPRGCLGVVSTKEYERATDSEREIGGKLQTMSNEARDELFKMLKAQNEGQRIDQKEAARLSEIVNEINADLAAIMANPGRPVPGAWAFADEGRKQDVRQ